MWHLSTLLDRGLPRAPAGGPHWRRTQLGGIHAAGEDEASAVRRRDQCLKILKSVKEARVVSVATEGQCWTDRAPGQRSLVAEVSWGSPRVTSDTCTWVTSTRTALRSGPSSSSSVAAAISWTRSASGSSGSPY